jgi:hypothetical protein
MSSALKNSLVVALPPLWVGVSYWAAPPRTSTFLVLNSFCFLIHSPCESISVPYSTVHHIAVPSPGLQLLSTRSQETLRRNRLYTITPLKFILFVHFFFVSTFFYAFSPSLAENVVEKSRTGHSDIALHWFDGPEDLPPSFQDPSSPNWRWYHLPKDLGLVLVECRPCDFIYRTACPCDTQTQ